MLSYVIGQRLREIRKEKEMTVEDLAEKAKLPEKYISSVEAGYFPSKEKFNRLLRVLDVNEDEFFGEEVRERAIETVKRYISTYQLIKMIR